MRSLALVHATSFVAKELRERLDARPELCRELRLLSSDEEEIGTLADVAGAAALVGRLDAESFDGVDLAFFCGPIERDRAALQLLPKGTPAVLLSNGATAADGLPAVAGVRDEAILGAERLVSPHPASVAVVLLLGQLAPFAPKSAVATVVQPVSVEGEPGLDELLEQTRGILAFARANKGKVFPGQIAFNLMPSRDGAAAAELAAAALGADYPLAIEVVQGGVFHSMAISLHVELGAAAESAEVRKRIARSGEISAFKDARRLGPVSAANEERLLLGAVRPAGPPGAFWIWAAMDNLVRGGALNAIGLAERVLAAGAVC